MGALSHLAFASFSVLSNSSTDLSVWFFSASVASLGALTSLGGRASSLCLSNRSLRRYHHQRMTQVTNAEVTTARTV